MALLGSKQKHTENCISFLGHPSFEHLVAFFANIKSNLRIAIVAHKNSGFWVRGEVFDSFRAHIYSTAHLEACRPH